jgi:8-amino-7-oxononanoate synthase
MSRVNPFECRLRRELSAIDSRNLRRTLRPPSGIDLCSNDYLCLAGHPLLRRAMAQAAEREGCGSTGSRLLRGEREAFSHLERRFAAFKGSERSLYFSSGYLANLAVLSTFPELGDVVFSDAHNHASLIDGMRLSRAERRIFHHCDAEELARLLARETATGQKFVVTESLFSMDGDSAPLSEYTALCAQSGAALIVDEAHAVGIYGPNGSGLLEACQALETGSGGALISINTCGKALGVSGALVAGPHWAIEYLVQRARPFIFSTAAPPPVAAALDESLTIIRDEPWRRSLLRERARHLRRALGMPGNSPIVPVVLGDNQTAIEAAEALEREGFDVRAIRPPSVPPGTARLRISVNIGLSETTLDRLVAVLSARELPQQWPQQQSCCAASS